jgi:iron complex outermembrane receptor protein
MYGLDTDATLRVTERLTLGAGLELMHSEFTSFPNADFFNSCASPFPTICSLSAKGKQLPQAPNASGTLNVDYRMPVAEGELHFNANEAANSGYYFAPNNEYKQGAYGLTNGSVAWSMDRYTVTVWGKNLTNVIYPISLNQAPSGDAVAYAAPRTFGVTLGATF